MSKTPDEGRLEDEKTPDEGRLDFSKTPEEGRLPIEGRKLNLPMLLMMCLGIGLVILVDGAEEKLRSSTRQKIKNQ